MTQTPLRIGFVGTNVERGWARDAHFPALQALPGLAVQAVSARDQATADRAAAAFGAASAYADSLALARDLDVDVVAVTVKVPEHRSGLRDRSEAHAAARRDRNHLGRRAHGYIGHCGRLTGQRERTWTGR